MVRIMESIRLEFQPNIKSKILELLSSFSSEELTIVQEDLDFDENKRKLELAYAKLKSGNEKMYTIEEADAFLDKTFSKYDS
jgi:tmRNA-binding protein